MTTYELTEENIRVGTLYSDCNYGLCIVTEIEDYIGTLGKRVMFYIIDKGEYHGAYTGTMIVNYVDEILEVPEG